MLILQIFWRMFIVLLVFLICIYPITFTFPEDPNFIKWKITIFYGLFGVLLMVSGFVFKKGIIGLVKPSGVKIPAFIWPKIDVYYSVVFLILAILNAWFVIFMSVEQWLKFRLSAPTLVLACCTVLISLLVSNDIIKHQRKTA